MKIGDGISADDLAIIAAVLILVGDIFALFAALKEKEEKAK